MRLYLVSLLLGLIISLISPSSLYSQLIHGELFTWHKVIIDFEGPSSSEYSIPNPFSDYRLDVLFTGPSNQTFRVPGFFSADGNASESSADLVISGGYFLAQMKLVNGVLLPVLYKVNSLLHN